MTPAPFLQHSPTGASPRLLQVHTAELALILTIGGAAHANVHVLGTLPGQTTDDRGVAGWCAPFGLDITTATWPTCPGVGIARLMQGIVQDVVDPPADTGFVYFWDHEPFAELRCSLQASTPRLWRFEASGRSTAGDRFALALTLDPLRIFIRAGAGQHQDAEAFAQEVAGQGFGNLRRSALEGDGLSLFARRDDG